MAACRYRPGAPPGRRASASNDQTAICTPGTYPATGDGGLCAAWLWPSSGTRLRQARAGLFRLPVTSGIPRLRLFLPWWLRISAPGGYSAAVLRGDAEQITNQVGFLRAATQENMKDRLTKWA